MSLNDFFKLNNIKINEGYSQQITKQVTFLKNICKNDNIKNAMEIGFNAGHSAEIFLKNNKNLNLTSFDLGVHKYGPPGKIFIDKYFPNRHKIILGDSKITIPKHNNIYDLIFIDGGHDYNTALSDLLNCKKLSNKNTIVIMDDYITNKSMILNWNEGPIKAWKYCIENKIIKENYTEDFEKGRGVACGNYIFT